MVSRISKRQKFILGAVGATVILLYLANLLWIPGVGFQLGLGYVGAPIHYAAHDGDLAKVKALVESGVSVDMRDGGGGTPLTVAIESEHFDVADFLIRKGANINSLNRTGGSPFDTYYINYGSEYQPNFKIVDYMLSKGFDPQKMGYEYPLSEQEALRNR
jgi:ankyrin repeat protein